MLERSKGAKHGRERSRRTDGEVQRRGEDHHAAFGACSSCEREDAASEDDFFGERALRRPVCQPDARSEGAGVALLCRSKK